jgi:hypothetical protein
MGSMGRLRFTGRNYFARSWTLLTRAKGWPKTVLLLCVASLVPIVGPLFSLGYIVEWARLTAWGVDAYPKQRGIRIGRCIASGWRAFVIRLVYVFFFVSCYLGMRYLGGGSVFSTPSAAELALQPLVGCLAEALVDALVLRGTIYRRLGAGLHLGKAFEMVRRDPAGYLRVAAIDFVWTVVEELVVIVCLLPIATAVSSGAMSLSGSLAGGTGTLVRAVFEGMYPALVLAEVLMLVSEVMRMLVRDNAVALWMLQFDVPRWGRDEDPLPGPEPVHLELPGGGIGQPGAPSASGM